MNNPSNSCLAPEFSKDFSPQIIKILTGKELPKPVTEGTNPSQPNGRGTP